MKLFIPFFVLSLILTVLTHTTLGQTDTVGMQSRLKEYVSYLSSDSMNGRSVGSLEERAAGKYFAQKTKGFRKSKLLSWEFQATKKNDSIVTTKMFARLINNKANVTVIIGAHIDHIGYGDELSLSFKESGIHNGADDNASGVAALIELHNRLAKEKLPFNLLIVPFTAHEIGTFGSEYLSKHLPRKSDTIECMLNMDMVGRMSDTDPTIYISESDALFDHFSFPGVKIVLSDKSKVNLLDSKHFVANRIPSATFSTGMHTDYHKISDDEKYINYQGIAATVLLMENWLRNNSTEHQEGR